MQPLRTTLFALALVLAACESNDFGGSNARTKDKDADAKACSDSLAVEVGEERTVKDSSCVSGDPEKMESHDTDIATVGPDGKIVGKKPGETDVTVLDENGDQVTIHVTVTADSSANPAEIGDGGDTKNDKQPSGDLGETDDGVGGCEIAGDRIKWKWPKKVQDCFDDKKLWDFTREECTSIPEATSFDCDWDGIDSAVQGMSANFTPGWDQKRLKIISCGERESAVGSGKKKTVVWQYVMLPKDAKNGKCSFGYGAGMAIGCFANTSLNLQASSDPSDLHACMDE